VTVVACRHVCLNFPQFSYKVLPTIQCHGEKIQRSRHHDAIQWAFHGKQEGLNCGCVNKAFTRRRGDACLCFSVKSLSPLGYLLSSVQKLEKGHVELLLFLPFQEDTNLISHLDSCSQNLIFNA
jgi:hypothetical protein